MNFMIRSFNFTSINYNSIDWILWDFIFYNQYKFSPTTIFHFFFLSPLNVILSLFFFSLSLLWEQMFVVCVVRFFWTNLHDIVNSFSFFVGWLRQKKPTLKVNWIFFFFPFGRRSTKPLSWLYYFHLEFYNRNILIYSNWFKVYCIEYVG